MSCGIKVFLCGKKCTVNGVLSFITCCFFFVYKNVITGAKRRFVRYGMGLTDVDGRDRSCQVVTCEACRTTFGVERSNGSFFVQSLGRPGQVLLAKTLTRFLFLTEVPGYSRVESLCPG